MRTQYKLFSLKLTMFISLVITTFVSAQKPAIEWVNIPSGSFIMGVPENEQLNGTNDYNAQAKKHKVAISGFKMSKYEITIKQFKTFIDQTGYVTSAEVVPQRNYSTITNYIMLTGRYLYEWKPGSYVYKGVFSNDWNYQKGVNWKCDMFGKIRLETEFDYPVVHVSWEDASAFAKWMGCRLPTEAEWEYACKAGSESSYYSGNNIDTSIVNYDYTRYTIEKLADPIIKRVGSYPPNPWGLCEMMGNVREWCNDYYAPYTSDDQKDPKGPSVGDLVGNINIINSSTGRTQSTESWIIKKDSEHIIRGGSCNHDKDDCKSAFRRCQSPSFRSCETGFRLVLSE